MTSTSERGNGLTAASILSLIVVTASVVSSLGGLLVHNLYRDDGTWATSALRGGDIVTLLVMAPALVVAVFLTNGGSARALLVWIGTLAYAVYNFAFYVFGAAFNDLFLVHVLAFSSAVFALIALLPSTDAEGIARRFGPRTPRRTVAGLLVLVGLVFAALWITFSLRYAVTGTLSLGAATLPGMHLVFALDLSLMAPSMVLGGILLWRRRPWGFVLASALSVFGAAYQLNLTAAGVFQANAHVEGTKSIDPVGIAFIAVFLVSSVLMMGNLRDVPTGVPASAFRHAA
jgi:hypothetical protein